MKKIMAVALALGLCSAALGAAYFAGQLGFERPSAVLEQTIGVSKAVAQGACPAGQVWCCKKAPFTNNLQCSCVWNGMC